MRNLFQKKPNPFFFECGFTMIEITIVIAVFTILLTLSYTNFIRPQKVADYRKIINILRSDIRHQQIKTMSGEFNQGNATKSHGIYFDSYSYTLFNNSSYSSSDPTNYNVELGQRFEFSDINLPSDQIIFTDGNGEINNFNGTQNTVTLRNIDSGETIDLTFGKYGVLETTNE